MRAAVEISMYPLTGDYRPPIRAFIDRLNTHHELQVLTNTLSTQVWGPLDRVLAILADEIQRAADGPQLVFVLKVLPGLEAPPAKSDSADETCADAPSAEAPSAGVQDPAMLSAESRPPSAPRHAQPP